MLSPTFDLAQHPTSDTIRLLASLLERMTTVNDQLNKSTLAKKGASEMLRSSSASCLPSSSTPLPSPATTTAIVTTTTNSNSNDSSSNNNNNTYTLFHAKSIPSIDIYSYLSRILKYCPCANECFLSLLVYFDRMSKNALAITGQPFTIDSFNIHRLIISGVMVSSKFFSDIFYTNSRYAKVGGLPVSELNRLELEFLQLNDYNILVSIDELQRYGDQLLKVGLMEQEMRSLYDNSSSYTVRHGRSTSLGSTALVRTLDGFDGNKQRKSTDQQCVQQLVDGTMKIQLGDVSLNNINNNNTKRHSLSSFNKYPPQPYHGNFINKDMCIYASPLPPAFSSSHPPSATAPAQTNNNISTNGTYSNMRRMGSMGNLHSYHQSPLATATTEETIITQQQQMVPPFTTTMVSPPLYIRQPFSRYDGHQHQQNRQQRYSFADWPATTCSSLSFSLSPSTSSVTTCSNSPPKPRQRHESMGLDGNTKMQDNVDGWRAPRQTRSSINLYQQNTNSVWATTAVTNKPSPSVITPMGSADSATTTTTTTTHQYQQQQQQQQQQHHPYTYQYQYHYPQNQQQLPQPPQQQQQQLGHHHPQYPHHYKQQSSFHLGHYHYPANGGNRRLSLTSVHAPAFIPQRPASADYVTGNNNGTVYGYYPVASPIYGIPTPPPSSSPIHHHHKSDLSYLSASSSSHQLCL